MELYEILGLMQKRRPLIQCITNFVTVNDCANILLASGASPTMAQDIREVEESAQPQMDWCVIWVPLIWWTP